MFEDGLGVSSTKTCWKIKKKIYGSVAYSADTVLRSEGRKIDDSGCVRGDLAHSMAGPTETLNW